MAAMGKKGMSRLIKAMGMKGGNMALAATSGGIAGMGRIDRAIDPDLAAAMGSEQDDLAFIQRLQEREGFSKFFEQKETDLKVVEKGEVSFSDSTVGIGQKALTVNSTSICPLIYPN